MNVYVWLFVCLKILVDASLCVKSTRRDRDFKDEARSILIQQSAGRCDLRRAGERVSDAPCVPVHKRRNESRSN